ncbi:MAG: Spy/CpxP family protein refolding chaperone [Pyrinomonadaceae bacterium]
MSFKSKFISAITLAFAVFTFTTFVSAQETPNPNDSTQTQQQKYGRRNFGKRGGGEHHGGDKMMMRSLERLNLSGAQKEQTRGIFENLKNSTAPQREELGGLMMKKRDGVITADEEARAKELKKQMRVSGEQMHSQILAVLTPEQKTQLDQMQQEMKQKMMERRQNRQNNQQNQTTPPPSDNQ